MTREKMVSLKPHILCKIHSIFDLLGGLVIQITSYTFFPHIYFVIAVLDKVFFTSLKKHSQ